jgi:hypothetical protein
MKTACLLFFVALPGAWAAGSATPTPAAPLSTEASAAPEFGSISPDYKKPTELLESFFNPFKIQPGLEATLSGHEVPAVSNDAVLAALSHRGLSGLLYGKSAARNRVIIGDEVFSVGDELIFASDKDAAAPLVTGATVFLRAVQANNLLLEVTPTGEAPRPLNYSLRAFWRP